MVKLEKITSSLFPRLYEAFLHDDDPLSSEADWRNVFDYAWDLGEGYSGYAMLDNDEVVGMMAMVFSRRSINGVERKFCNLHTWWVREDYRGRSVAMLRPVLRLNDYTITHFTPCDRVRAVTKRLGFKDLNSRLRILLPQPIRSRKAMSRCTELFFEDSQISPKLDVENQRILRDHQPYRVGNLLVQDGTRSSYVLYTHVIRHRLPYCHVHYVSDMGVYQENEVAIRSALLRRYDAKFVAVDDRLTSGMRFQSSFKFWAPAHALYKSDDVTSGQIDNLYSDVVFLRLTCLPDMSYEIGRRIRGLIPRVTGERTVANQ
mgnify:CR=1 FL=1|jgi:hypothetical protein